MSYINYLDPSFGSSGTYNLDIKLSGTSYNNVATSIGTQSTCNLVVAGYSYPTGFTFGNDRILTIMRYNVGDNDLDITFGTDGIFTLTSIQFSEIGDMYVLPDDKMLVVGTANNNQGCIVRVNEDGTLDTSFGTNGILQPLNGILPNSRFNCLDVYANGDIIIGGSNNSNNPGLLNILLVKLTSDGLLDTSFGINGYHVSQTEDINNILITYYFYPTIISDVKFDLNGKIVACGNTAANQEQSYMIRLNADGTRDNTFGNKGLLVPFGKGGYFDIIILPDGKYLVGGYYNHSYTNWFKVMRITSTGNEEVGFTFRPDSYPDNIVCKKIALTPDNKLLCFGYSAGNVAPIGYKIMVARFNYFTTNQNPTIDTTYGTNGYIVSNINAEMSEISLDILDNNYVYVSFTKDNANKDFGITKLSITLTNNLLQSTPKTNPTITNFTLPQNKPYGDIFTITPPTSDSTGYFTYKSSDTSIAKVVGKKIGIVGVGTTTITARQSGTLNYYSGTISTTLTSVKATPVLTNFSNMIKNTVDGSFVLTDPSSTNKTSGFTYTSSNTSIATISGSVVTLLSPGSTTITATQESTINYNSASTTANLAVYIKPTITNFLIPNKTYGDSPFAITTPTSDSIGAFTYTSSNTSVATISGSTITIIGAGTATITATQAQSGFYNEGFVTKVLIVSKATPNLTNFTVPSGKVLGDSDFNLVDPISNSNGSFTFKAFSNGAAATVSGRTVKINGVGSTLITATQNETANFNSANITATLTIGLPTYPICFLAGTPVLTDQGEIAIEKINCDNTIRGKKIVAITKTITIEDKIVCIEKDALGENIPSQKTFISRNHKLLYNKQMIKAKNLIGHVDGVYNKKYKGEVLYNVLLETHEKMIVNNLIVETLDPNNIIAQLYNGALSVEERNYAIVTINQAANEYKNQYGKLK